MDAPRGSRMGINMAIVFVGANMAAETSLAAPPLLAQLCG
jgi:hypothetical protein